MEECPLLMAAMEHHRKGESNEAIELYKKYIASNKKDKRAYINLAALLRAKGESSQAGKFIVAGLSEAGYNSPALHNTLGNCLRDLKRYSEAINSYRRALKYNPDYFDPQISIVCALYEAGFKELSDRCLYGLYKYYGAGKKAILNQIIITEIDAASSDKRPINPHLELILSEVDKLSTAEEPRMPLHWFLTSQLCCDSGKIQEALSFHQKAAEATQKLIEESHNDNIKTQSEKLHTVSSWNLACNMLRQGEMKIGWKLYDYGLNTPCEGAQRWQRALYKPYSFSKLPLWKGQCLKGKRILLLGEQGIGDTMAFITLTNSIVEKASHVTFIVPKRLKPIYNKTMPNCTIYSDDDFRKNPASSNNFDYQSPLGSCIQFCFKNIEEHKSNQFRLIADLKNSAVLRKRYLKGHEKTSIIGISWQGGGKKERIKDKSIKLDELLTELAAYNIIILSLQYGDDSKVVENAAKRHGINFIDDPNIQATSNMHDWIDQVEACDGVISIANTTIHGAGGLCKPTLCLLGSKSDWRWLKDKREVKSYWYPTVEIAWQEEDGNWESAIKRIPHWLKENNLI